MKTIKVILPLIVLTLSQFSFGNEILCTLKSGMKKESIEVPINFPKQKAKLKRIYMDGKNWVRFKAVYQEGKDSVRVKAVFNSW